MKKENDNKQIMRALGLFTQLGFTMAACIAVGVFLGKFADSRLGTSPWLLLFFSLIGAVSAFKAFYDMIVKEWMD